LFAILGCFIRHHCLIISYFRLILLPLIAYVFADFRAAASFADVAAAAAALRRRRRAAAADALPLLLPPARAAALYFAVSSPHCPPDLLAVSSLALYQFRQIWPRYDAQ